MSRAEWNRKEVTVRPASTRNPTAFSLAVVGLLAAGAAAYWPSWRAPFLLDDMPAIVENASIRNLTRLGAVLSPPAADGNTVGGRPLLNLSFALNYALSGTAIWSYHALNLILHAANALLLFGIVWRTLTESEIVAAYRRSATPLAFASALFWLIHPLDTESVTYVAQRAESLMGFFYLSTVYAYLRGVYGAERRRWWWCLSLAAALAGMATKEVMVTAPVVVLLYDRTFVSRGLGDSWRLRGRYLMALFATWVLLAVLVIGVGNRGGSVGATTGLPWWGYAFCQARAWWHYVRLAILPSPLIFDYGWDFVSGAQAAPFLVIDIVFIVVTGLGLWRGRVWAFLAASAMGMLAPSSSVIGGTRQMLAEHRMYLSLVPLIVGAVVVGHRLLGRRALSAAIVAVLALVAVTTARNWMYRSERAIWTDTVAKRDENPMAHGNLGLALVHEGDRAGAQREFETAVRLDPTYAEARNNLGNIFAEAGQFDAAVTQYRAALASKPNYAEALSDLGDVLTRLGRPAEALSYLRRARETKPEFVGAAINDAMALVALGRAAEARNEAETAVRLDPRSAAAHNMYGVTLARTGDLAGGLEQFREAVRLDPRLTEARQNQQRAEEAIARHRAP